MATENIIMAVVKAGGNRQVGRYILRLCLGWYGQRWSFILQQPARGRVATAAKPVAASRLWCAVPVKQHKQMLKRFLKFNWVTTNIFHIVDSRAETIH